jgi:hypothetical protein
MNKLDHARQYATDLADKAEAVTLAIAGRRVGMERAKAKALAEPARGRLATGWFAAWSRVVGPLAQSVAKLDRLRAKLPAAVERAEYLAARSKVIGSKKERNAAFIAAMTVRLDALRKVAPEIDARWKVERAQEAKRIKAHKKLLRARHQYVEHTSEPAPLPADWLAPTVVQPTDADLQYVPSIAAAHRPFASLLDADPLPAEWTSRHVGARLIEAQRVVRITPEAVGPKGFGRAWPAYAPSADDIAGQEAVATYRPRASAHEIARAMEAINWPIQFLSNRGGYAVAALIYWADQAADPDANNPPHELLQAIATALAAAKEPVR